jgi:hypothetical protein
MLAAAGRGCKALQEPTQKVSPSAEPGHPVEPVAQPVKGDAVGSGQPVFERPNDQRRDPVLRELKDEIAAAIEQARRPDR